MDLNKHSCLWVEDMAQPKHRNRKERVVWGTANESVTLGWRTVEGWNGNVARNHCNVDIEIQMNKLIGLSPESFLIFWAEFVQP